MVGAEQKSKPGGRGEAGVMIKSCSFSYFNSQSLRAVAQRENIRKQEQELQVRLNRLQEEQKEEQKRRR